jgi:hypothetical protein
MAFIKTVQPEEAQGIIKEGYEMFMQRVGIIPKPMEMMSVSPVLFELQLKRIHYLSSHPKLSFALLAHIRYLVAKNLNYAFCTDLNKLFLEKQGLSEDDFRAMEADPSKSLLEENESALLDFVVRAVKSPEAVTEGDFKQLKDLGWEDRDIFDALTQGATMVDNAIMMQVFQMDQDCMLK